MNYSKLNDYVGWLVFAIATAVYVMTLEPTVSFWDCGEFISACYKLQVVHPPGAPFFLLLGRIFTMFAPSPNEVAWMVNLLSGLSSSFCILFLFWTITALAKKFVSKPTEELNTSEITAILGAGIVGALAYTFTDSFWFSAVEGEVYALSSFFTAIVFWAIVKWEARAHQADADRWLILIAYLMGLSLGVHLLNLLCIPAICFVYYFKRNKTTRNGTIRTFIASAIILVAIQYGIIPGIPTLATKFDLLFVNSMGMPFGSGLIFFFVVLIGATAFGLWFTQTTKKDGFSLGSFNISMVNLNTAVLTFCFLLIGYSSYTITVIRSNSDTSIDMNNPENPLTFLSYLNREQYGNRPLFHGPYFTAQVEEQKDGKMRYRKGEDKYEEIGNEPVYVYEKDKTTFFPRAYSAGSIAPRHISFYESWMDLEKDETPNFFQNIKFFFTYQLGHMYWRYFMWNFAGRQNDIQGQGNDPERGNWMSGIPLVDNIFSGAANQNNIPESKSSNKGRNNYYLLPFLLGIFGLIYQYKRNKQDFLVVFTLFFMTGIAINIYLNMPPLQPRERDYAYVGSFYAYAIWIGFSVMGLWAFLKDKLDGKIAGVLATAACLIAAPVLMASQNWDDHDRSKKTTARDFAYDYLNSCSPNAVLFSMGDNDTYPLWYAQEVERARTDIRIVNLSLLGTGWYIKQMRTDLGVGPAVNFTIPQEGLVDGKRDYVPFFDNPAALYKEKFQANKAKFELPYGALLQDFMNTLNNSSFPTVKPNDYQTLLNMGTNFPPNDLVNLLTQLSKPTLLERFGLNSTDVKRAFEAAKKLNQEVANSAAPLKAVIDFIASDEASTKAPLQTGEKIDYLPTKKFLIPVDKQKVLANGTVAPRFANQIVDYMEWTLPKNGLYKNDLMILDLVANNDWEKPIYFTISMGPDSYIGLQKYFQIEGLTYRLVPVEAPTSRQGALGFIQPDTMYNNMMNKYTWGNMDGDIYTDPETNRMTLNLRSNFSRLAEKFLDLGDNEKVIALLDKCNEVMPPENIQYNILNFRAVPLYYEAGAPEKAKKLSDYLFNMYQEDLNYYVELDKSDQNFYAQDAQTALYVMHEIVRSAEQYNEADYAKEKMGALLDSKNRLESVYGQAQFPWVAGQPKEVNPLDILNEQNQNPNQVIQGDSLAQ